VKHGFEVTLEQWKEGYCHPMPTPSVINAALNKIPKRAESRAEAELRSTFEDSGVGQALDTVDHQIIYGRRGTGKTHALRYLTSVRGDEDNIAIYVDLRTIGSAEGVFGRALPERNLTPHSRLTRRH
jgi:Cdc6-like AAA superfamily ATPase